MGRYVKNKELKSGSYSIRFPQGSGAVGPNSPVNGLVRYNTIRSRPESFYVNRWRSMIGNEIDVPAKDTFYGDGYTVEFSPMSYPYPAGNEIFLLVFIQNVFQNPGIAYLIDNYKITFTSPPPSGHAVVVLHGVMNGSAFEPIPAVPTITLTTSTTSNVGTTTTTTLATTSTTTLSPPSNSILNFVYNGDFEITSPRTETASYISLPGWRIYKSGVRINGFGSFLGCPTPNSTIPGYQGNDDTYTLAAYSASIDFDSVPHIGGSSVLFLTLAGSVSFPNAVARGPILVSDNYLILDNGDILEFWFKIEMKPITFYVEENYDVFAYLQSDTCQTITLTHATGTTIGWNKVSRKITYADAGNYRFIFVAGSFDRTGGQAVGTQVYIDNVRIVKPGMVPS